MLPGISLYAPDKNALYVSTFSSWNDCCEYTSLCGYDCGQSEQ